MTAQNPDPPEEAASVQLHDYDVLMPEALELLRLNGNDIPAEQREHGERDIGFVAMQFVKNLELDKASPRLKHLREQLGQISTGSGKLAELLNDAWPHIRRAAVGYGNLGDWYDDYGTTFLDRFDKDPAKLMELLPRVTDVVDRLIETIPADTGGEQNLFRIFNGSPKRVLAVQCFEVFWEFRDPREATGTEGGDYHKLIAKTYSLATGRDPDSDRAGLHEYAKQVAKYCNDLLRRKPALERLRLALAPGQSPLGMISYTALSSRLHGTPMGWAEPT